MRLEDTGGMAYVTEVSAFIVSPSEIFRPSHCGGREISPVQRGRRTYRHKKTVKDISTNGQDITDLLNGLLMDIVEPLSEIHALPV